MRIERQLRFSLCEKIFTRTMVIPRTWIRKEVYSTYNERPRGEWDRVAELMMIKFRGSGHPVFRATSPLSRGTVNSKGGGQLSIPSVPMGIRLKMFFTGRPVLAGQSDPLFESAKLLTMTPKLSIEIFAQEDLLQKYQERAERLSQQNRAIKFCIGGGFLTTVDVGQYFMTKDTEEFSQFVNQWLVVGTLCQEMKNHVTRKVGFEGTPKLDPCWKSQPVTCKVNMEWKLELNL